jgi:predicted regulator of Ras-like GTPase activity (Roadblock/LC7/MglB family)
MREILKELNDKTGTSGSMVITPDGIMVAAALGDEFEEDVMAAFASSLLLSLRHGVSAMGRRGGMTSCTVNSSKGKLIFLDMKNCFLVVVADSSMDVDSHSEAIQHAIHKITSRRLT